MKHRIYLIFLFIFIVSCTTAPKKRVLTIKSDALIETTAWPELSDDLNYQGLAEGLLANIQHLNSKPKHTLQFGDSVVSSTDYALELEKLHAALVKSEQGFVEHLKNHFQAYKVFGRSEPGEAFVTSYYAPEIAGSKSKTKEFNTPLYALPKDMVIVRLDEFKSEFGKALFEKQFCKKQSQCQLSDKFGILRARLNMKEGMASEVIPYWSREDIHNKPLDAEVLAWVDPIEAFFLQIQGSGTIRLSNGKTLQLGYAGQNGHAYEAIGKHLFDVIPKEKMSLQTIEQHLKTLSDEEMQSLLNKNASYVFFKEIVTKPVTYFGIETIDGRTIATDKRFFPKGALSFLTFKKPEFNTSEDIEPSNWQTSSRFVFDHDTGGAIKGGGRLDLFWGRGTAAKQAAGVIKHSGVLFYFLPKVLANQTISKP